MFDNILENAFEASRKVEVKSKRFIKITVADKIGTLLIQCENQYNGDKIKFVDEVPQSTKSDIKMHGLGTKSIKKTVSKYNGFIKYATKKDVFITTILF